MAYCNWLNTASPIHCLYKFHLESSTLSEICTLYVPKSLALCNNFSEPNILLYRVYTYLFGQKITSLQYTTKPLFQNPAPRKAIQTGDWCWVLDQWHSILMIDTPVRYIIIFCVHHYPSSHFFVSCMTCIQAYDAKSGPSVELHGSTPHHPGWSV